MIRSVLRVDASVRRNWKSWEDALRQMIQLADDAGVLVMVSGVVGSIPRGLESVIDETLRRLEDMGEKVRIPAKIVGKPGALRVQLLMGALKK